MKALLLPTKTYRLNGRLWLETDEGRFLGIGRLELLEQIAALGSISKAAQAMGMSYKRAWDLVSSMNAQAATPLVATQTGGSKGGGASVTEAGHSAIAAFTALQARFQEFMAAETNRLRAS
ncbi:winged helix-turn-helix domain-containing protein [Hymenobacter terricola]|uniref:winged helix-turn-helix domain-containing protein n=1 Tax=Hymenobacter terricola TaxID=2819236 RepID=UPI001B30E1A8|nr:LysR family transcriptional regulator [Hymenobacter terricola]